MPHAYTEDQLVEQPAKANGPPSPWPSPILRTPTPASPSGRGAGRGNDGLIAEYSAGPKPHPRPFSHSANPHPSLSQWERSWEKGGRPAGLRVRSLVLVSRLRPALERLDPALPPEAITGGGLIEWLTADCRKSLISSRFLFE